MKRDLEPWKVLDSSLILDRKWLRVRQERVETARGVVIDEFHVIESSCWAGIVCVTAQRELVLVEQYRHGHRGPSLELPAGVIESGEDWLDGAQRELREETGYTSEDWKPFWRVRPEPARHDQWVEFFVAKGAQRTMLQHLDETEDMRVVLRPLDDLDA
ncbi:MAG TPA: NUDIX hydrolase, partial [Polyangiaceae bacterium]|nr:NUDIX hydrolase [Polyangiaceae bacterium]